jgi:hypothetical protein
MPQSNTKPRSRLLEDAGFVGISSPSPLLLFRMKDRAGFPAINRPEPRGTADAISPPRCPVRGALRRPTRSRQIRREATIASRHAHTTSPAAAPALGAANRASNLLERRDQDLPSPPPRGLAPGVARGRTARPSARGSGVGPAHGRRHRGLQPVSPRTSALRSNPAAPLLCQRSRNPNRSATTALRLRE